MENQITSKKMSLECHDIILKSVTSVDSLYNGKQMPKIVTIEADITTINLDEENDEFITLGHIKAYKVSGINAFDYDSIFFACDDVSLSLCEAFDSCFKKSSDDDIELKKASKKDFDSLPDSFIYIDELKIGQLYRGSKIGTLSTQRFIDDIGNSTLLIVKPWAIEDEDNKETHKRVQKFWSSLGFKKAGNSGFYITDDFDFKSHNQSF